MSLSRREFLEVLAVATASGLPLAAPRALAAAGDALYDAPRFGSVSLLHITDCHAQLLPVYFREPSANIGVGPATGRPPHLVGEALLKHFKLRPGTPEAHAYTHLDFERAAQTYGKVGGFAHLAALVKRLKAERPGALLLDGGDTWQGSATALWTNGQDMVDAAKLLGVDVMTAHWEFTLRRQSRQGSRGEGLQGARRFRRAERADAGLRRPGVPALRDQAGHGGRGRHRRPGVSLYADRQSALLRPRLDLRHPGAGTAGRGGRGARARARRRSCCSLTTAWTSI